MDAGNLLVTGSSQGGGLALITAGLYPTFKAAVANVTRLVERPIGWGDRVQLSWAPDAAMVLTR